MSLEPSYLIHYVFGTGAILLWWSALLSRKGSPRHKRRGRWFLTALAVTLVTVGLIFFASSRTFAAIEVVQFSYLVVCVVTVGSSAFLAIRCRRDVDRFRGPWLRVLALAAFVMGCVILSAGLTSRSPLPIMFSWIGLLYGGGLLRFAWFKAPLHPNWWLGWHLNGVCVLFDAVHGTFLAVSYEALFDAAAGDWPRIVSHTLTMSGVLGLRLHFGRRFNAPLRFGLPAEHHEPLRTH